MNKSYRGVRQLTEQEAIGLAKGGEWKDWTPSERGRFCLYQKLLCIPFDMMHEGVEAALGRPVWTHEFAMRDALVDELEGKIPRADMAEVFNRLVKLADGKPIVVMNTIDREAK